MRKIAFFKKKKNVLSHKLWHIFLYSFYNLLTACIPTSRDRSDNKIIRGILEMGIYILYTI